MRLLYVSPADLRAMDTVAGAIKNLGPDTINRSLASASSLADSYVSSRYSTPFLQFGDDFKRAVTDIAVYDLLSGRGMNLDGNDQNFRLRYEDALKWLERVNKGTITPEGLYGGSTSGGTGPSTGTPGTGPALPTYQQNSGVPRITSARPRRW